MNASGSPNKRDSSSPKESGSNPASSGKAASNSAKLWLRPAKDWRRPGSHLRVKDPVTLVALPVEGAAVRPSVYWTRRLMCGDVLQGKG